MCASTVPKLCLASTAGRMVTSDNLGTAARFLFSTRPSCSTMSAMVRFWDSRCRACFSRSVVCWCTAAHVVCVGRAHRDGAQESGLGLLKGLLGASARRDKVDAKRGGTGSVIRVQLAEVLDGQDVEGDGVTANGDDERLVLLVHHGPDFANLLREL